MGPLGTDLLGRGHLNNRRGNVIQRAKGVENTQQRPNKAFSDLTPILS